MRHTRNYRNCFFVVISLRLEWKEESLGPRLQRTGPTGEESSTEEQTGSKDRASRAASFILSSRGRLSWFHKGVWSQLSSRKLLYFSQHLITSVNSPQVCLWTFLKLSCSVKLFAQALTDRSKEKCELLAIISVITSVRRNSTNWHFKTGEVQAGGST